MAGTGRYFYSEIIISNLSYTIYTYLFIFTTGLDTEVVYPNGISMSLPESTQYKMLRTIPGLEDVVMIRPGDCHLWNLKIENFIFYMILNNLPI